MNFRSKATCKGAGGLTNEISPSVKQSAGSLLWQLGKRSLTLRRILKPLGLRTKLQWYEGRIGRVSVFGNKTVWLTAFNENYLSFELFWKGWTYYEPHTMILLHELLSEKDVFLDIGANIGYFSLAAAAHFADLQIIAFEPSPKLYRILNENVARNGFSIETEALAISNRTGSRSFFIPPSDMSGTLERSFNSGIDSVIEVETSTLDEYVQRRGLAGRLLLKIDTEGHEPAVLRGARETLARFRPDLILEVTEDYHDGTLELLKSYGYKFYPITDTCFEQAERVGVVRKGDLLFLNTFVTQRDWKSVRALYDKARRHLRQIDLRSTSLFRPEG